MLCQSLPFALMLSFSQACDSTMVKILIYNEFKHQEEQFSILSDNQQACRQSWLFCVKFNVSKLSSEILTQN